MGLEVFEAAGVESKALDSSYGCPLTIIVLTDEHSDDADWRAGAYAQFLRDDPQEDAIYDSCR